VNKIILRRSGRINSVVAYNNEKGREVMACCGHSTRMQKCSTLQNNHTTVGIERHQASQQKPHFILLFKPFSNYYSDIMNTN